MAVQTDSSAPRLADPATVLIAVSIIAVVAAFTAVTCLAVPGDVFNVGPEPA